MKPLLRLFLTIIKYLCLHLQKVVFNELKTPQKQKNWFRFFGINREETNQTTELPKQTIERNFTPQIFSLNRHVKNVLEKEIQWRMSSIVPSWDLIVFPCRWSSRPFDSFSWGKNRKWKSKFWKCKCLWKILG